MKEEVVYIFGFAKGRVLPFTTKAATFASLAHQGQIRKDGSDYIDHPVKVCRYLINYGIYDDETLAAALLHDVVEESGIKLDEIEKRFNAEIAKLVDFLSKKKSLPFEEHMQKISSDIRTILIKSVDRMCNVGDMIKVFTKEQLENYIQETECHIVPLIKQSRMIYVEHSDTLVLIHDSISNVIQAAKKAVELWEENIKLEKKLKRKK